MLKRPAIIGQFCVASAMPPSSTRGIVTISSERMVSTPGMKPRACTATPLRGNFSVPLCASVCLCGESQSDQLLFDPNFVVIVILALDSVDPTGMGTGGGSINDTNHGDTEEHRGVNQVERTLKISKISLCPLQEPDVRC